MTPRQRRKAIDPGMSVGYKPHTVRRSVFRSVGAYAVVATIWIFTSDLVTQQFAVAPDLITTVSIIKGIAFVAVTSILLLILVRNDLSHLHRALTQQRLLAQGTEALRAADTVDGAWHDLARVLRIHGGFDFAEVWLPEDEHTLALATIDGLAPARLNRPAISGGELRHLSKNQQGLEWLWSVKDGTTCLISRGATDAEPHTAALIADHVIRVIIDGRLEGVITLSSNVPSELADYLEEPVVYLTYRLEETLERFRLRASIEHSVLYDELTDLPNRVLLVERLKAAIREADATGAQFVLLACELDVAERVRQSLGDHNSDQIIREAAARLKGVLEVRDTLARSQSYEFLIIGRVPQKADIAEYLSRLNEATRDPVSVGGLDVPLSFNVGVHVFGPGSDIEDVLQSSASALNHAKLLGRGRTVFYDEHMRVSVEDALQMEVDLRTALEENQLEVEYQPIIESSTGEVRGAEALVRWNHPTRGRLYPGSFIPVAEDSGLILEIGQHVVRVACGQCAKWVSADPDSDAPRISVNLSAHEFMDPDLIPSILHALDSSGLAASRLTVEITETTLMQNPLAASKTLETLASFGVRIALDDFGTGYSSLAYLQQFDIDVLKIDASFISGVPDKEESIAITRAIIQMAKSLGLETVAEGVETREQADFLRAEGADFLQGYLFGKPTNARLFTQALMSPPRSSSAG